MFSLRQTVVMAVAIIGLAAAHVCTSDLPTDAYTNNTDCAAAIYFVEELCTCTGSTWNSTSSECSWTNATMGGNCTGAAGCIATFSASMATFTGETLTDSSCASDFAVLHSCFVSLETGTDSLWNATGMYAACVNYADTVLANVANEACVTAAVEAEACPTPLAYTVFFTFGGNWTAILSGSSRRARARSQSAAYTSMVAAIDADIAHAIGYTPTSVSLQLTANGNCLATVVLPISTGSGDAFVAVYGGSNGIALFTQTSAWFSVWEPGQTLTFLGAGTSPVPFTPTPATPSPGGTPTPATPSPSAASVATVANVLLALLALVLVA